MNWAVPTALRYTLRYAGHPAGEQRLTIEPRRDGLRVVLEANVELPLPKTRQRWESELNSAGLPRRYRERVEGNGTRVMEVEFSAKDGLVTVSQGKDDFAIPYLTPMHDPLSLILAVGGLDIAVGQVERFTLVGGRAYVERLPDQALETGGAEAQSVRVYRLRPGLSLLYFNLEGYPVRFTQKVGEHVFEADLMQVQQLEVGKRSPPLEQDPEAAPRPKGQREQGREPPISGEPPKERESEAPARRRRRRRRYI